MKVKFKEKSNSWLTTKLKEAGYTLDSQFDIKKDNEYVVHAISIWVDIIFYQIIGESGFIFWIPANLVKITDRVLPNDWLVNQFDDEVSLIIGPNYISDTKDDYAKMVELYPEKIQQFYDHYNNNIVSKP